MRFSVKFPSNEIRSQLRRARVKFGNEQGEALNAIGVRILSFARQDYVTKGRGGVGTDGIKWKPLAESTIKAKSRKGVAKKQRNRKQTKSGKARPTGNATQIGIDTGLQFNSSSPGFAAAGGGNVFRLTSTFVTVGFGRFYSEYFDEDRPLLPSVLPDMWREACEQIVERWAERLLSEVTNGR